MWVPNPGVERLRVGQLELQVEELRNAERSLLQLQQVRSAKLQSSDSAPFATSDAAAHTGVLGETSTASSGVPAAVKDAMQVLESSLQAELHHVRKHCDVMQERVESQVDRVLSNVEQKLKDYAMKVDQLTRDGHGSAAKAEEQELRLSIFRSKLDAYEQRLAFLSDRDDRARWLVGMDSQWAPTTSAPDSGFDNVSDIAAPPVAVASQAPCSQPGGGSSDQLEHRLKECERALESMRTEFAERSMKSAMPAQAGFTDLRSTFENIGEQFGQKQDCGAGLPAVAADASEPLAAQLELHERLLDPNAWADERGAPVGALRQTFPVSQRSLAGLRPALDETMEERQALWQVQSGQMHPRIDLDGKEAQSGKRQPSTDADGTQVVTASSPGVVSEAAAAYDAAAVEVAAMHRRCDGMLLQFGSLPSRMAILEEHIMNVAPPGDGPSVAKRDEDVIATRRIQEMEATMQKLVEETESLRASVALVQQHVGQNLMTAEVPNKEFGGAILRQHEKRKRVSRELDPKRDEPDRFVRAEAAIEELGVAIARQQEELAHVVKMFKESMDVEGRSGSDQHAFGAHASTLLPLRKVSSEASCQAAGGGNDVGPCSESDAQTGGGDSSTTSRSNDAQQERGEGAKTPGGGSASSVASSSFGLLQQYGESARAGIDSSGPTPIVFLSTPAVPIPRAGLFTANSHRGASASDGAACGGSSSRPESGRLISVVRPCSRKPETSNVVRAVRKEIVTPCSTTHRVDGVGETDEIKESAIPASSPPLGHGTATAIGRSEKSAGMPRREDAEGGGGLPMGSPANTPIAEGDGAAGPLEAAGGGVSFAQAFHEGDGAPGGAAGRQRPPHLPQAFSRSGRQEEHDEESDRDNDPEGKLGIISLADVVLPMTTSPSRRLGGDAHS